MGGLRGCPDFMGVLRVLTSYVGKHLVIISLPQNHFSLPPWMGREYDFVNDKWRADDEARQ